MSRLITRRRSVTNAPPSLPTSTAPNVSAPLIGEPTPLTEATPTASQVPVSSTSSVSIQPLSARRPHRRRREPEPSDHTSSASRVEDEASQPAKKNTRGPSRMLNSAHSVRQTGSKIKIEYDPRHCGPPTPQQHSAVVTGCGVVIKQNCPMQWESWADIPDTKKELVRDKLSAVFDLKDISPEAKAYLEEGLATRYKHWKNYLHTHFQQYANLEVARLHGCPAELKDRPEDWEWLCKHFTDPKFVKKSIAGKKARESKTLLHHSGSKPFSYRLEAQCQRGSKFPEIDTFEEVYVRPKNGISEHLHDLMVEKRDAVLQEATSQFPPETPIEYITVSEDVGFQIVTDVMEQNFGRRHGKVIRCMGKTRVREKGASSSKLNTPEVDALKEQVTTLQGQLEIQGEQMRAQGEQMKEQMRAQGEQMRHLVRAIQMSGIQISLPVPDLATPSTIEPLEPADT